VTGFVDLAQFIPGLAVELRYATAHNFLGRVLYPSARAYLREPVARKLAAAQAEARSHGLALKIWDAFRPAEVQRQMWAARSDPRFVAPPERGSRHTRGAAVDVTLIRREDGLEVRMGSGFDEFVPAAASDFTELPESILVHRRQLRAWMTAHGFTGIRSEWWHFDDSEWEAYPLVET